MIAKSVTDGEKLGRYLEMNIITPKAWINLAEPLWVTNRSEELLFFFRHLTAVNLVGRLVIGGNTLAAGRGADDPTFKRDLRDYISWDFQFPRDRQDQINRLVASAIKAARHDISTRLYTRMKQWAQRSHPYCYMCGVALDFYDEKSHLFFTCEHIWPRSYGGNSEEANLLPACASCNEKKGNFATWVMPSIQALILGIKPNSSSLGGLHGSYKFALHYRAAQRHAEENKVTLKQAFLAIGPWENPPRVLDDNAAADFFNLTNLAS